MVKWAIPFYEQSLRAGFAHKTVCILLYVEEEASINAHPIKYSARTFVDGRLKLCIVGSLHYRAKEVSRAVLCGKSHSSWEM